MPLEIRLAEPSDSAALTVLARRAKAHWGYPARWLMHWKTELTLTPAYLTVNSAFVAVDAGGPLGVCVLQTAAGPGAALEHVWVAPEHHRRGIGRRLVRRALDEARARGFRRVEVQSDPFAEPFYLKLGARRLGAVPAPMPGAPDRVLPVLEFVL